MPTVLVIDDEPALRKVVRILLEEAGYEVNEAGNGVEGLQVHSQRPAEVVLCDIYMEPMDGFETIGQLLQCSPVPRIIATSGVWSGREHLQKAISLGAVESLPKPFGPEVLLETVDKVLQSERN